MKKKGKTNKLCFSVRRPRKGGEREREGTTSILTGEKKRRKSEGKEVRKRDNRKKQEPFVWLDAQWLNPIEKKNSRKQSSAEVLNFTRRGGKKRWGCCGTLHGKRGSV